MVDLTLEEKQEVMQKLRETIPNMSRRQLECWILCQLDFTQDESAIILDIDQANVSRNLGNLWDILERD